MQLGSSKDHWGVLIRLLLQICCEIFWYHQSSHTASLWLSSITGHILCFSIYQNILQLKANFQSEKTRIFGSDWLRALLKGANFHQCSLSGHWVFMFIFNLFSNCTCMIRTQKRTSIHRLLSFLSLLHELQLPEQTKTIRAEKKRGYSVMQSWYGLANHLQLISL